MLLANVSGAPRRLSPLRARAGWTCILIVCLPGLATIVHAQGVPVAPQASLRPAVSLGAEPDASEVELLVGRSAVLNVPTTIARISLTSPDVADAMVTTPQQVLIHGKTTGTISMFVWDRAGAIRRYEVVVRRDLSQLDERLRQLFPNEQMAVSSNGRDVIISGSVASKYVMDKAAEVAAGYVEKKENVVNLLQQREGAAGNQVMLRVRFAEVSRSALSELGASFFTGPGGFHDYVSSVQTQQFPSVNYEELLRQSVQGAPDIWGGGRDTVTGTGGKMTFSDFLNLFIFNNRYNVGTLIKAMQQKGLFQSLAEPNLIALNGKEASFLAGGEYPYPVATPGAAGVTFTIQFKEFGIRLNFTPTIVGGDVINLRVRPEVSALDFTNAIIMEGFRIPALSTRRTETEVELRDGQTFAIAGLLNNNLTNTMRKIPGIGDIPVLGWLFKSRALAKNQTELVVMITPQIIRRDSVGVSAGLPSLAEPYLGRPDRSLPNPAPYTGSPRYSDQQSQSGASAQTAVPVAPVPGPAPARADAQGAPAMPPSATGASSVSIAPPAPAAASAAAPSPAAPAAPTKAERAAMERARREELKRREVEAKVRQAEERRAAEQARIEAKRAAEQARIDAERAAETKRQQEIAAREQAKRDAEAARQANEARQRQEEAERKRGKALAEAEARLKAAQAAYQKQLERSPGSQD